MADMNSTPIDCLSLIFPYFELHIAISLRKVNRQFSRASRLKDAWNSPGWKRHISIIAKPEQPPEISVATIFKSFELIHQQTRRVCLMGCDDLHSSATAASLLLCQDDTKLLEAKELQSLDDIHSLCIQSNSAVDVSKFLPRRWYSGMAIFPNLTTISIHLRSFSSNFLFLISRFYCHQLITLQFYKTHASDTNNFEDTNHQLFAESLGRCSKLQNLRLGCDWLIPEKNFGLKYLSTSALADSLIHLTFDFTLPDDSCYDNLLYLLPFIKLTTVAMPAIPIAIFSQLMLGLPNLSTLLNHYTLDNDEPTVRGVDISKMKNLKHLEYNGKQFDSASEIQHDMQAINQCTWMKYLSLTYLGSDENDMILSSLAQLANLTHLDCCTTGMSSKVITGGYFDLFKMLQVFHCDDISLTGATTIMRLGTICGTTLKELSIRGLKPTQLEPVSLAGISEFPALEKLSIQNVQWWNDASTLTELSNHWPSRLFNLELQAIMRCGEGTIATLAQAPLNMNLSRLDFTGKGTSITILASFQLLLHRTLLLQLNIQMLSNGSSGFSDSKKQLRDYYTNIVQRPLTLSTCVIECWAV
jgi:hypothetical protein